MKQKYKDINDFILDLHKEPVKQLLIDMGYITEEEFNGSKICCKFHEDDHTPSLQITDFFFKCYSCGAKGDIIQFVQLKDNLIFIEAIYKIADFLNVDLENTNLSQLKSLSSDLKKEWDMYIKDFNIVCTKTDEMSKHIRKQGQSFFPQQVGYDKKINYLVLPFTSKSGGILGFTKRKMNEKHDGPKWIHSNSKDTLISNCSNIFNLNLAYEHMKKNHNEAIFAEGPRDVAAFQKAGFLNTFAICGTGNFSLKVWEVLSPIEKIIMGMDGDEPGKEANINNLITIAKIYPIALLKTYIIDITKDEDPASISQEDLKKCMDNKVLGLDWIMNNANDIRIRDFYANCNSEIVKPRIINSLSKAKNFNYLQAQEWFSINEGKHKSKQDISYKDRLLSTVGMCSDPNIEPLNIPEDQANRILKLRFNIQ